MGEFGASFEENGGVIGELNTHSLSPELDAMSTACLARIVEPVRGGGASRALCNQLWCESVVELSGLHEPLILGE